MDNETHQYGGDKRRFKAIVSEEPLSEARIKALDRAGWRLRSVDHPRDPRFSYFFVKYVKG